MGVPILFSWLNQKHPNCINKEPPKHTDVTYIDLNALIHNCYNSTLNSMEDIYKDMINRLKKSIDNIVNKTRPKKVLYIAVDGVAPAAKLAHQRSRRYKAACEKSIKDFEEEALNLEEELLASDIIKIEGFDSNAITPGTELMEYLHKNLMSMISYSLSVDPLYKNLKVLYSSYLVPGEGEQKIMAFLRKYSLSHPSDTHVLYSPDGDIIFLGVGLYNVDFYIMREDTFNNPNKKVVCGICSKMGHTDFNCNKPESLIYTYVDIPEFRNTLIKGFNLKIDYDRKRMLVDWVFVCFFIGNDFLPGIPCVDIKIASIESLSNILIKNFINCRDYITTNEKMINFHVLENFLISLSNLEDNYYVIKTRMLNRFCQSGREEIPLQTKQGKIKYYSTKLNAHNQNDIDSVSIEYITGLIWIYNYYINGRTNWDWVYPYHFAPFVGDLVKVVRSRFSLKFGAPLSPFEQLMVVIPPQSKTLVSEKFHIIYEKFAQFYPIDVQSDMFDKYLSWTSVILLPHLNSQLILADVKKIINQINAEELGRNASESDLLFTSEKDSVINLQKLYFNLKPVTKYFIGDLCILVYPYYKANYTEVELTFDCKKYINKSIVVRFDSL